MKMKYVMIKDHLEQAQAILGDRDRESTQLKEVLEMVIGLIDELQALAQRRGANVIEFPQRLERSPGARN
ncbi:MAG TPA: hypothetical protein VL418_16340 [Devosiaceae bacterium]|nr:hypothetical protein [Devosiaceae bacterium]